MLKLATERQKKDFFKEIGKKYAQNRKPFNIMFELTHRCNFNCIYCYLGKTKNSNKKELTLLQIKRILEQLKEAGVYNIGFTGGEPFTRPDIFDILEYARGLGFSFGILTNGYPIDRETIERIKKICPNNIEITFHAMNEKIFDRITGVRGSYKRVKNAVELLFESRLPLGLKTSAMKINKDEVIRVNKYARSLGVLHTFDAEITPCRDNCTIPVNYSIDEKLAYRLRKACYPEMFSEFDQYDRPRKKRKRDFIKRRNRLFNCGVGQKSFSINPYGQMNFCLEIDYPKYNILKGSVKEGWAYIKKLADGLNKLPKGFVCLKCDLFKYCGWCAGRSYLERGNFYTCSEYFKERAKYQKAQNGKRGWGNE